jgi:PAS domain S-box-containing protein
MKVEQRRLKQAYAEVEKRVEERTAELQREITERKCTEEALTQELYLLQTLLDNLPDNIYFKDIDGRFIRISKSKVEKFGLSDPAQVVGKTDFDFFTEEHARLAFEDEQRIMRTGQPLVGLEEKETWPDGSETWVTTTKMPLRDKKGLIIGTFGISTNITERKQTEERIRKLNEELKLRVIERTTQLEAVNKELKAFVYSVSHDLRAPLRAIDGYTNILVEDHEQSLDEEGKRVCAVICSETKRMGQLIDDLLSFSHISHAEMQVAPINMETLVYSVFNELTTPKSRGRIDFHVASLPLAIGDLTLMHQLWMNLLSNAIKFSSKRERAVIEVGYQQDGQRIIYSVRDNGAGFDMQHADNLFTVFWRLHSKKEFEGTGVGLAIVQRLIHRHGGEVWAESQVDKGATFYFTLEPVKQ